ncbi:MAG: hypothetical protein ACREXX_00145, partial [Gammaproteobacteria bacterium]
MRNPASIGRRVQDLHQALDGCMYVDRPRLRARLRTYLSRGEAAALDTPPGVDTSGVYTPGLETQALKALEQAIREASLRAAQRAAALPRPELPSALPITARCEDIAAALTHHQVVVVCGETGSGKSTQLPKLCL